MSKIISLSFKFSGFLMIMRKNYTKLIYMVLKIRFTVRTFLIYACVCVAGVSFFNEQKAVKKYINK